MKEGTCYCSILPFLHIRMKKGVVKYVVGFLILCGISVNGLAQDIVEGCVFVDNNRNGIRDKGEKGIQGIAISNGDTVLLTDKRGNFKIELSRGNSIFPILSKDWTLSDKVVNAGFYYRDVDDTLGKWQINFGLNKKKVKWDFSMNAIGDVQVGDVQELEYASRSLWPELLQDSVSSFNLFLGDLVNNNLALFPAIKQMMEELPVQSWTVLGNHDRDVDSVRVNQTASYNRAFGSPVYAFNEGNVHFIIINNVYGKGTRSYVGKISDSQLRFISNDLRYVDKKAQIVLCMHIPLAQTLNSSDLFKLLEGRGNVLSLVGHMHQVKRNFFHGKGLCVHELVVGASCGFWWVGEKNWEGLPSALMQCGTPRNYFVFDFSEKDYSFRCKGVGLDASRQMNISVAGIDSTEVYVDELKVKPKGELLVTVYGASDSTMVRCRLDNGSWLKCEKAEELDVNVARMRSWNQLKVYPSRFSRRNPFRKLPSPQVWRLLLPDEYCAGVHKVVVEASDRWGFKASGMRTFYLH